jgi:hypothetical protein
MPVAARTSLPVSAPLTATAPSTTGAQVSLARQTAGTAPSRQNLGGSSACQRDLAAEQATLFAEVFRRLIASPQDAQQTKSLLARATAALTSARQECQAGLHSLATGSAPKVPPAFLKPSLISVPTQSAVLAPTTVHSWAKGSMWPPAHTTAPGTSHVTAASAAIQPSTDRARSAASTLTSQGAAPQGQAAPAVSLAIPYISQYQGLWSSNCDCGPASVAMTVKYLYGGYPGGITSDPQFVADVRSRTGNDNQTAAPCDSSTYPPADTNFPQLEQAITSYGLTATLVTSSGDDGSS